MLTPKDKCRKPRELLKTGLNTVVVLTVMVWPVSSETASTAELKKHCEADLEVATKINTWTNHNVVFKQDYQTWGVPDYWQTPRETLHLLTGDCEDYAVFKYHTIISWGIPPDHVQVWYGRVWSQAHMVVIYCGFVLDNLTDKILPLSQSHFKPKFRVDGTNLRRWQDLTNRQK
jgi:predicted transglutaminase-like cysteine proteinase